MCHAGISPQWDLETARQCAREVERIIQGEELPWLLKTCTATYQIFGMTHWKVWIAIAISSMPLQECVSAFLMVV